MRLGAPIDSRVPYLRRLLDFDAPWREGVLGVRLREVERTAFRVGAALRAGPRVVSVRTLPLTTLLYPTKYAFQASCRTPVPYVVMTHRCLLVQLQTREGVKNLLFNPTHYESSIEAPFFRNLADQYGEWFATRVLTKRYGSVQEQLGKLGLSPADIDLIAFDHFHTQDLRPLFGTQGGLGERPTPGIYPRALLLAPKVEWDDWDDLHPFQKAWFVRAGKLGIPEERVVLTDGDIVLGEGALLLRTPGHTSGNQTLFCHADEGVFGVSENGTCVDNWAPRHSQIAGLAETAELQGLDVILNANTPEAGATQYTSMMLERAMVDPVPADERFFQMFSSSEVTPSLLAPGIRPSLLLEKRESGVLVRSQSTSHSVAAE